MTLLEVLVAMTVLAIGVVGALGAVVACVRSNTAAEQYSLGTLLAERVAAELDRRTTPPPGELSGVFDSSAPDYSWTAQMGSADADGLYPARIIVFWHNQTRHLELDTSLRPHTLPAAPAPAQNPAAAGTSSGGAQVNS
jgi:prepilin-type N-terminal cleavage/methylation domain-containing protein